MIEAFERIRKEAEEEQKKKDKKKKKKGKKKKQIKIKRITCDQCSQDIPNGQEYICILRGNRVIDKEKGHMNKHDRAYHICDEDCLSKFIKKKVRKESFLLYRYNIMKAIADYEL